MPSLTDADFERHLDRTHIGMLAITVAPQLTTEADGDVPEAFRRAYASLKGKVQFRRKVQIFFLHGPTRLEVPGVGSLTVQLQPHVLNAYMEDSIYINAARMRGLSTAQKTVGILEELVHVLASIQDETLVKNVVCLLMPGVTWDGQRYGCSE